MTYLQRSSEKNTRRKRNLLFVGIAILILLFGVIFRNFSANVMHTVLYPVTKTANFIFSPIKNLGYYFYSKPKLVAQNTELENEKKFLQIELLATQSVKKENAELRSILEMRERNQKEVVAEIILTPPFSPYDTFVIRTDEQVAVGQSVFIRNTLVGKITEIHKKSAVVTLYSTAGHKIPVRINDTVVAEAEGQGGLAFNISIPKDLAVSEGDLIYSMEHGNSIIGIVDNIEVIEKNSFKVVHFQYPFNFSETNFVQIRDSVVE